MFRMNDERKISVAFTNKRDGSAVTIVFESDSNEWKNPDPWVVMINNKNDSVKFLLDEKEIVLIIEKLAQKFGIL